jgi:DNA-binding transcriptional ArsR family regulator
MSTPIEKALAYLDTLEADRRMALALSEQKAEEARLIKARQEGFQAAMEMLGLAISPGDAPSASPPGPSSRPKEPGRRRVRRHIRELILRELSFSGQAMTATQIAKAIDYQIERTEMALQRMEETGQVLRNAEGRWAIGNTVMPQLNGHAATGGNGKSQSMPDAVDGSI